MIEQLIIVGRVWWAGRSHNQMPSDGQPIQPANPDQREVSAPTGCRSTRIRSRRSGQGLVEYAFLLALLVFVGVAAFSAFGAMINEDWLKMLTGVLSSTEQKMNELP